MKSLRITTQYYGTYRISSLPLPTTRREGTAGTEGYRNMAKGEPPRADFNPNPSDALRSIRLSHGRFTDLAAQQSGDKALLNFIISGRPRLVVGSEGCVLEPGDIFLADPGSACQVALEIEDECRLIQMAVGPDWPGAGAELPDGGTHTACSTSLPKLKRIYTGDDGRAYYAEFPELFAACPNQWSEPTPIAGFRMLRWKDGFMDWHPTVINQLAILSSGQMEFELGGGGGAFETFHAGGVCIAEDRTGEGHRNRVSGVSYVTIIVIKTEDLWPWANDA